MESGCLVLDKSSLAKKRLISLIGNSLTFHKILTLLDFVDEQLIGQSEQKKTIRKRAVYYSVLTRGFTQCEEVDDYIAYACQILSCSRADMCIEASAKSLFAGTVFTAADQSSQFDYL